MDKYGRSHDSVLQFDNAYHTWSLVGRMQHARDRHAASVVRAKDINYCGDVPSSTTSPSSTSLATTTTTTSSMPTTTVNDDDLGEFHQM